MSSSQLLINYDAVPEDDSKGASVFSSVANVSNAITGAAVLTLSYAILYAGLISGLVLLLLVALISAFSFSFLSECCAHTNEYSYKGIAKKTLGKSFGTVVESLIVCYTAGTCISYCVILGDFMPSLSQFILPATAHRMFFDRRVLIIATALLILLPLCLLPNIDALRYTSAASLFCPIYLILMMGYRLYTNTFVIYEPRGEIEYFKFSTELFAALPLMGVSFTAHYNIPKMYQELKQRSVRKFRAVIFFSVTLCLVLYSSAATLGYVTFRSTTKDDILNNYGSGDIAASFGRAIMGLSIALSFPLVCFGLRNGIQNVFIKDLSPEKAGRRQAVLSTSIISVSVAVAILEESVTKVIRVSGSLFGFFITCVFPGLFYLKCTKGMENVGFKRVVARFIILVGLLLMVNCTYASIMSFFQ
ncbi:hypothetical protein P9112_006831 [Eukaryota sp. TZLM1-RC]